MTSMFKEQRSPQKEVRDSDAGRRAFLDKINRACKSEQSADDNDNSTDYQSQQHMLEING